MDADGAAWSDIVNGRWLPLDDKTLHELTMESMRTGNFALRLAVAEIWRMKKQESKR